MIGTTATTLVVGTGYVGRRVLESLDDGEVIGLSRSALTTTQPVLLYDLDGNADLPLPLPDDYRVLYTVAPATEAEQDTRLGRLLERLDKAPAAFVYISTTGVYGDHGGALVAEDTEPAPLTARAKRRVAAERLLRQWCAEWSCCGRRASTDQGGWDWPAYGIANRY